MTTVDNQVTDANKTRFRVGPGLLVTAAFIGPGTVVTASKAGAQFGCELLWTVLFACFGTIVLQSLAARLGILTKSGLGEAIRRSLQDSPWLRPAIVLVVAAIGIGNAAYQTGNLTGAVAGLAQFGDTNPSIWIVALACLSAFVISIGRYRWIHRLLVSLVIVLSLSFIGAAAFSLPSPEVLAKGLFIPQAKQGSLSLVIGLIGTTIVPYNLFLHASSAASTWKSVDIDQAQRNSFWDTVLSVSLGGLVTACVILTANSAFFETQSQLTSIDQIGVQLEPTLGRLSSLAFSLGLFAAGLTSAITAPLATAYAVCGCLGWESNLSNKRFRSIAFGVIAIGGGFAIAWGKSPTSTILFAQVANGLLLPIVASFLLVAVYKQSEKRSELIPNKASTTHKISQAIAWVVVASVSMLGIWRVTTALL